MSTLIKSGEFRCDAKCYNAKEPKCNCICGGRNHGNKIHNKQMELKNEETEMTPLTKESPIDQQNTSDTD